MNVAIPILALLLFVAAWAGVVVLLSQLGWKKLVPHFQTTVQPEGEHFFMASMWVGTVRYKGALHLWVMPDGVYLYPIALFSLGHVPLFIPWSAIREMQQERMLGGMVYRVWLQALPKTPLLFQGNAGETLYAAFNKQN